MSAAQNLILEEYERTFGKTIVTRIVFFAHFLCCLMGVWIGWALVWKGPSIYVKMIEFLIDVELVKSDIWASPVIDILVESGSVLTGWGIVIFYLIYLRMIYAAHVRLEPYPTAPDVVEKKDEKTD